MKLELDKTVCACGRAHVTTVDEVIVGHGVINKIPRLLEKYGSKKPFILMDCNTYQAAGRRVCELLEENGIAYEMLLYKRK